MKYVNSSKLCIQTPGQKHYKKNSKHSYNALYVAFMHYFFINRVYGNIYSSNTTVKLTATTYYFLCPKTQCNDC